MKIKFLGGVSEVGRLGMLLETGKKNLLFDYGISPTRPPQYPLPTPRVDLAFLSHAHVDHSGMMPWMSSRYQPPILATKATAAISGLLTRDSLKVARSEGYVEHYSRQDISIMEQSFDLVGFDDTRQEAGFDISFHSAGHIPGATMFHLQEHTKARTGTGTDLLFTGDINTIDTRLVRGGDPVQCDTLVMESTYSGRDHPDRRDMEKRFLDSVDEVVSRGGTVVIPAFAVGRSQEIMHLLKDTPYDIWFDGMGKEVTRQYLEHPEFLNDPASLKEAFHRVNIVNSYYGRKQALRGDIIITTSGMLDGGPVLFYLDYLSKNPNCGLFLTGYQVKGTNGHLLLESGRIDIKGVQEKVDMDVRFFDFSAHAGHLQLREFANKCNPQQIILFHSDQREILAADLREDGFIVNLPDTEDTIEV
jgi:putative mRNA 3-end processing factor